MLPVLPNEPDAPLVLEVPDVPEAPDVLEGSVTDGAVVAPIELLEEGTLEPLDMLCANEADAAIIASAATEYL